MNISKNQLFKRQITLSEIGELGQQKLQNASVLVVGCGGLGSPIAVCLASSGIGKIHLIDFDTIAISNLHRQVFYTLDDVGKSKALILAEFIKKRAPYTKVNFTNSPLTKQNVFELISDLDIVIDATDSLPTKYLLNDACVLKKKPLVYGSLYKFDGYVSTFNILQKDGSYSSNLRDAFPTIATDVPTCEEAGTLNSIVHMIAAQQVNEVIKLITKIGEPLINELLLYNTLKNTQFKIKLQPTFLRNQIETVFKVETYEGAACSVQHSDWQISSEELQKKLGDPSLELIAVLPNLKLPFHVHQIIPIQNFKPESIEVDFRKTYVMVCQKGMNSEKATKIVKEKYPDLNVFSLTGGVSGYEN